MTTHAHLTRRAAMASVVLALILIAAKAVATLRTDSVAMLGSLADSGLDLIASLVTLLSVRIASTPADDDHRFGHGKAEAIAALTQTGIIIVSAVAIGWRAVMRLTAPTPVEEPLLGVGVSMLAIVGTLGLVLYQRSVARRTRSIAIRADALHYQSDLLLNMSVILALGLEGWFGLLGADAALGVVIALYLMWGAVTNARDAVDMLMDKEWPEERRQKVIAIVKAHPEVRGVHELRTRSSGSDDFIQFHIWVNPEITVQEAHRIADEVEGQLEREFPQADVLIHVDPEGHFDRHERDIAPL